MDTENKSFPAQLNSLWTRLNASEKLIVVASGLILLVALGVWISVARQPDFALLYGNLEPTDAGVVIGELQSKNIKYQVRDGGRSILVPADAQDELRIELAGSGFSPTGTTGYEILEQSTFGMSDRLQRTRTTQALEGELARTLISLDEITAARVHLNMPQPTPFIAEQTEPAASVVINVSPPGATLSADKIAAVRTFVAGAVATDADNVTIIDQNMNLLTGPTASQPGGLLPTQEDARRNYENQRAADIRSLLERAYGIGKVAVSFSCEMDFDEVQTESLTYDPVTGTDHGILVSEERTEDSTSGDGYTAPVGVPGTESNIPSYVGTTGEPFESDSTTEVKNYEVSQTHEMRVTAPGTVQTCSVGVLIDSADPDDGDPREILQSEIDEVEDLVASAALLDIGNGDKLTVAFRPFDTRIQQELEAEMASVSNQELRNYLTRFGLAFLVLLIFWVVLRNFLKPIKGTTFVSSDIREEIPEADIELPEIDPEQLEKLRIREEIERLIKEDPAAASKVIKTWLKE